MGKSGATLFVKLHGQALSIFAGKIAVVVWKGKVDQNCKGVKPQTTLETCGNLVLGTTEDGGMKNIALMFQTDQLLKITQTHLQSR